MSNKRNKKTNYIKRSNQLVANNSPGRIIRNQSLPNLNNFNYNAKGDRVILGRSVRVIKLKNRNNEEIYVREEHDYVNSNGKNNSGIDKRNYYGNRK